VARQVFLFDQPDRFVAGTVGQPGERQFYLQARDGNRVVSVALEKQQVQVLAERVDGLLDEVVRRSGGETTVPATAPLGSDDLNPLDPPVTEEFRVGAMALGWNDLEEDPDDGPPVLRIRLTGAAARAFAKRAMSVVSAGRPPCPFCNLPLEPGGHICPRANGYRR